MNDEGGDVDLVEVSSEVRCRERGDAFVGVVVTPLICLRPERVAYTLGRVTVRSVAAEESKASIGMPSGLSAVRSMNGGTAETSTTWATRPVPCRPAYLLTSPPPVEKPTSVVS